MGTNKEKVFKCQDFWENLYWTGIKSDPQLYTLGTKTKQLQEKFCWQKSTGPHNPAALNAPCVSGTGTRACQAAGLSCLAGSHGGRGQPGSMQQGRRQREDHNCAVCQLWKQLCLPDFVSSRSGYQSYHSKCLEKAQVSAPLSLFMCGIMLSWGLVIKTNCAFCYYVKVSQIGALGSPFHLQLGKTHQVNSTAHPAAPFCCLLCNQVKSSSPEGAQQPSNHHLPHHTTSGRDRGCLLDFKGGEPHEQRKAPEQQQV